MHATLGLHRPVFASSTGLSPSIARRSSRLRLAKTGLKWAVKHHISHTLLHRIQFALCWFRSPLLTASQLISFPPGTKMFQFPGFPHLAVQLGDLRFYGCMRLAADYHSLPCPSSAPKPSHPLYGLEFSIFLWRAKCSFEQLLVLYPIRLSMNLVGIPFLLHHLP